MSAQITMIDSQASFPGSVGSLPLLHVENRQASALIALQGAQVLSYLPKGGRELLWVSPKCHFAAGAPLRGGIPLSLPWFAFRSAEWPSHGFVRTETWTLAAQGTGDDGSTWLELELRDDDRTRAWWGGPFHLTHSIRIGRELRLELTVHNISQAPVRLEAVWHSYFAIADIGQVKIAGLDGCEYIDKNRDRARFRQTGALHIEGPTDLIYPRVPATQTLERPQGRVVVTSSCQGAVVCNHWTKDRDIDDLGEGSHRQFICLERGDLDEVAVDLAGSQTYRAWMSLATATIPPRKS